MPVFEYVYDPLAGPDIERDLWQVAEWSLVDGSTLRCEDPNTTVEVVEGVECRISVQPFSHSHDRIQIADDLKTLLVSRLLVDVPEGATVDVEAAVAAVGAGNDPGDIRDGAAVLSCLDRNTNLFRDFYLNGSLVVPRYERRFMPGSCEVQDCFAEAGPEQSARPGERRRLRLHYDRGRAMAGWFVDDQPVYEAWDVVDCESFELGIGVVTRLPLYLVSYPGASHSRSLHGQGMTGSWSPIRVVTHYA